MWSTSTARSRSISSRGGAHAVAAVPHRTAQRITSPQKCRHLNPDIPDPTHCDTESGCRGAGWIFATEPRDVCAFLVAFMVSTGLLFCDEDHKHAGHYAHVYAQLQHKLWREHSSSAERPELAAAAVFTTNFADNIHINITVDAVPGTAVFGQSCHVSGDPILC